MVDCDPLCLSSGVVSVRQGGNSMRKLSPVEAHLTGRIFRAFWQLCLTSVLAFASNRTIWTIGRPDGSPREFGTQDTPAVYEVGKSSPERDWRQEQRGPNERGQSVLFTVAFALDEPPAGIYTLRVFLLLQHSSPMRYRVTVNGRSGLFTLRPDPPEHGSSADMHMVPRLGQKELTVELPAKFFRLGVNTITFALAEGDRVGYDAVAMEQDPARQLPSDPPAVQVEPTVLWERRGDALNELVNLVVHPGSLGSAGKVTLRIGRQTFSEELPPTLDFGEAIFPLRVLDSGGPAEARAEILTTLGRREFPLKFVPQRKWKLFAALSTHLDIGYTTIQPKALDTHLRNIERATDLMSAFPLFRWNVEGSWVIREFFQQRPLSIQRTVAELARQGRIGVNALYFNLQTFLCSLEELNRATEYSFSLQEQYRIPFAVATQTDVPSLSWALPSILNRAGVRYLASGANQVRGPLLTYGHLDDQSPFFWEGPDGRRVMVWYTKGYEQARRLFGIPGSLRRAQQSLPVFLSKFRPDYPYDAVLVFGLDGDNAVLGEGDVAFFKEWNSRYAYPQILPASFDDFFRYIEAKGTGQIPVYRGDGGAYWEDGAGECATATAINRRNQGQIVDVEKMASLVTLGNPRVAYPTEQIGQLWEKILLFDEHTFGARASVLRPEAPSTRVQWQIKEDFARSAAAGLRWSQWEWLGLLNQGVSHPQDAVVVWNLDNWVRSEPVDVEIPAGQVLYDSYADQPEPAETLSEKDEYRVIRFLARDVPPLGYKLYLVKPGRTSFTPAAFDGLATLENEYFKVTLDVEHAAIRSIYDKDLHRELADRTSPYAVGEYLYVAERSAARQLMPGAGDNWYTGVRTRIDINDSELPPPHLTTHLPHDGHVSELHETAIGWVAVLEAAAESAHSLKMEIRLYSKIKRIDLILHLDKALSRAHTAEAVYIAFPFALEHPRFAYELAIGRADPSTDMLPGAATEWFSVNNWVNVVDDRAAVTIAVPDAPLVTLGDVNQGHWPDGFLAPRQATVFSYLMNNYWLTNFPGGQERGDFAFRYSITSGPSPEYGFITRFGEGFRHPLLADFLPGRVVDVQQPLPKLRIDSPTVNLITMKRAKHRSGYVVRLYESAGREAEATFDFGAIPVRQAFLCSTNEQREKELMLTGRRLRLRLSPYSVESVLLETVR